MENKQMKCIKGESCLHCGSNYCRFVDELDQLKAELEQEKALKETYLTCYKAKHEDIEGELFKLKQTIVKIKEIAEEQIPYLNFGEAKTMIEIEYDYAGAICNLEQRMHKIIQKINDCEVEDA